MERINIRIAKKTHRRLNLLKGKMGIQHMSETTPTLDEVINAGLDLLEKNESFHFQVKPTEIEAVLA